MTLQDVLSQEYGVGVVAAPTVAIIWATERYAQMAGVWQARAELEEVNAIRARHGAYPAIPAYDSIVF